MPNTHGGLSIAKNAPGILALPDGYAIAVYFGTHAACTELMALHAALLVSNCSRSPLCPPPRNGPRRWVANWAHSGPTPLRTSLSSSLQAPAWAKEVAMDPLVTWSCKPFPPRRIFSCHFHASLQRCPTMWAEAVGPQLLCGVPISVLMGVALTDVQLPVMLATLKPARKLTDTSLAAMVTFAIVPKETRRLLLAC